MSISMIRSISMALSTLGRAKEALNHVADHPAQHRLTADEWETLAEEVARVANYCQRHANQRALLECSEAGLRT